MSTDVLYRGSVKDILAIHDGPELLLFHFSDRYSIFDWGEMPDLLEGKGVALATMSHALYKSLGNSLSWKHWNLPEHMRESYNVLSMLKKFKHSGVPHHMIGFCDPLGKDLPVGEVSAYLKVQKVHVERPGFESGRYDYSAYQKKLTNTLVPLEIVFRFGAPAGSSLLKRAIDPKYRQEVGLKTMPVAGEIFDRPVIEFFTKLESTDRYLSYENARKLAGMSANELEQLVCFTTLIAYRLHDYFKSAELNLWDGKIEVAFASDHEVGRHFRLVDSIGPDELRLDFQGTPMSKEVLRGLYRDSDWYQAIETAKKEANKSGLKDWKTLLGSDCVPSKLSQAQRVLACALYPSLAHVMNEALKMDEDFEALGALELSELARQMNEVLG